MRILLDQAVHDQRNMGNNALLEVAVTRLRRFWPEASFEVITNAPHFCKTFIPGTHPVSAHDLQRSIDSLETLHRLVPTPFRRLLFELREVLYHRTGLFLTRRNPRHPTSPGLERSEEQGDQGSSVGTETEQSAEPTQADQPPPGLYGRMPDYDLYVPSGGGYMCDSDKRFLLPLLDRLELAVAHGVPAVMVGQGIGPMKDPELLARAGQVLPLVDHIMIREVQVALPILDSLNVPRDRVIMTGDDAIELAYQARSNKLGTGIGLSLRVAHYTDVNRGNLEAIRPVVLQAARKYRAELVAAPIDSNEGDMEYIAGIIKSHNKTVSSWRRFEVPSEIIRRTSRCRVMISGTFHGAVFALGQGIPVIALAKSAEYHDKVSGLAAEFGNQGCQIIHLNDESLQQKLSEAIDFAWSSAEQLRPQLLHEAKRQIDLGYSAYQRIYDLVETKRQATGSAR